MGKLKDAHDHALTQWLKVIIFGIVMLAPFFAILSKCMYVACNKNAYESYYGETINDYKVKELQDINNYNEDETYYLNNVGWSGSFAQSGNVIYFSELEYNTNKYTNSYAVFFAYENNTTLYFNIPNEVSNVTANTTLVKIKINGLNIKNTFYENLSKEFTYREYNKLSYLDNVFEYSVSQLGETPIFAWTKNTGIYTPINNMTTGLGFDADNNTLAILLTYWALNTAIYIVFDLIIVCFTKITHFING